MKFRHYASLALGAAALFGAMLLGVGNAGATDPVSRIPRTEPQVFADAPVKPEKWTGVTLSAFYGYGAANGELTAGVLGIDGFSATGQVGGADIGARVQIPGTYLVPGIRAGYTWSNQEFTVSPGLFSAGIDKGWHADALLGAGFGTAMPYIGIGRSVMQTSTSIASFASPDLKGWRYIAGIEFRLPKLETSFVTPTVALEAVYTDNDAINLGGSTNLNVTDLAVMGRLNFQLWK